jgi:phosphohistidine phosphatase
MRVIFFRHGPAGTRDRTKWPDDALRPLTAKGEERTRSAAAGIARLHPGLRTIFSSPLTRAEQTARILSEAYPNAKVTQVHDLAPGGSYREILKAISGSEASEAVALVGHEPDLGKLAGTVLFGAPCALPFKKAGACAVEFDDGIRPGAGRLVWFLTPKMLRRLARRKKRHA